MSVRVSRGDEFDKLTKATMPNHRDYEQGVLGCMMFDNQTIGLAQFLGLEPHHLYWANYQHLLEVLYNLYDKGVEANMLTVSDELRKRSLFEKIGGVVALTDLITGAAYFSEKQVAKYVGQIHQKWHMRELIKTVRMIEVEALEPGADHDVIMSEAESAVLGVVSEAMRGNKRARDKRFVKLSEDKGDFRRALVELHKGNSSALPTGIRPFDNMLEGGGLQPQGLYIVAAEPKAGKTSLALGIAQRIARMFAETGQKRSVGVVSMEMRRMALQMRMFSSFSGVAFHQMSQRGFSGVNYEVAMDSIDLFFDTLPLYITDAVFSMPEIWRETERLALGEARAGLLIVDYIQLASIKKAQTLSLEHRTQEVSSVSRELKRMAQEFNIPVIGISSLNRAGQLRESGNLEYDCEALIILENRDFRLNMTDSERTELNSRKVWDINAYLKYQRNGPTGDVMLKFMRDYMEFLTPDEYQMALKAHSRSDNSNIVLMDPENEQWELEAENW